MTYDKLLIIDDIGKTFTAKAAAVISGGFLVGWNSGTDCVGSAKSTFDYGDIAVDVSPSTTNCAGIAMYTAESGSEVTIATEGIFILPAGSTAVTGGTTVNAAGYENMVGTTSTAGEVIGRGLTAATALTGFAIVKLNI